MNVNISETGKYSTIMNNGTGKRGYLTRKKGKLSTVKKHISNLDCAVGIYLCGL
jgi:hypothetical protein